MKKLPISKLNDFFSAVSKAGNKVYLPVDIGEGKGADYKLWSEGVELSKALNTNRSAKDFFFPQTENLFELKMDGKNIDVIDTRTEAEDFVVFGVRACDVRSFEVLDRVFLANPVDTYYKTRREHGVIISLACTKPAHTCFCHQMDVDATNAGGDIQTWMTDDALYLEALTEKGKALLSKIDFAEDADSKAVDAQKAETKKALEALPLTMPSAEIFEEKELLKLFNSPKWASLSESCLACGTCTFVCPTCQCYDIRDFNTGKGVKRFRCWDSCMYSDFTKMAAENPRKSQLERFRQRFMHKLVYYPTKNEGIYGCVGCGRCLNKCPISMNIVKVIKKLSNTKGDN
jgi:heterodisulfide reductase subunit C